MKFKKRRLFVDAYRFDSEALPRPKEIHPLPIDPEEHPKTRSRKMNRVGFIEMPDAFDENKTRRRYVSPGDWIVTTEYGTIYPCSPEAFERDFEPYQD